MNFLYDYHSGTKCQMSAFRHMRLCRQIQGGDKYEQAILPTYQDLVSKGASLDTAENDKYVAHDHVRLCDSNLDDLLISIHHKCEDYDKNHSGSFTKTTLFPNGNYGPVIGMNMYKEPAKALEIAQKIETFGQTHELYPLAVTIKTAVAASQKAITDEETAIHAEGLAKANAEVAKLQLIRKYNSNYYQAADEGGKAFAEKLFPELRSDVADTPDKPDVPGTK